MFVCKKKKGKGRKIGEKNLNPSYIYYVHIIHTKIYVHIYIHIYTYQTKTEEEEEEEKEGEGVCTYIYSYIYTHIHTKIPTHKKKNTSPIKKGGGGKKIKDFLKKNDK